MAPRPGLAAWPRRERRRVQALGAAIVLLLVIGAATVAGWEDLREREPVVWDPRVADLAAFVERARGLEFEHDVPIEFLTTEEYTRSRTEDTELAVEGEDDDAPAQDDADAEAGFLRALGVASGPIDLERAEAEAADSATLGVYLPDEDRIVVRGTELTIGLRVTLVHELTHALQDQHFDLSSRFDDVADEGGFVALRALAEGDAGRIEQAFVQQELSVEEQAAYEEEYAGYVAAGQEGTTAVPDYLLATLAVPYDLGGAFVEYLRVQGGTSAIDDAFRRPPTAAEHLFDPAAYAAGEEGDPPSSTQRGEVLPEDLLGIGTFGSPAWYLVLAQRLDAQQAFEAALGWGGDEYFVEEDDGRTCVQAAFRGDTERDEQEMAAALRAWAGAVPGGQVRAIRISGQPGFRACDPGDEVDLQVRDVSQQLLALPATFGYLQAAAAQVLDPEGTRCFAAALLDGISYERLADPEELEPVRAELDRRAPAARQRCGSGDR